MVFGHQKFSGPALKIRRTENQRIFTVTSFGGVEFLVDFLFLEAISRHRGDETKLPLSIINIVYSDKNFILRRAAID